MVPQCESGIGNGVYSNANSFRGVTSLSQFKDGSFARTKKDLMFLLLL